ncbi:putative cytokinetic ring protein SteA [Pseudactinotalea suaedae]|uniref:putative cytokinetic ring protein SteA n=1 Tax=Pseudactinotalea suaedae TaxID=1524924 RepID=UPI0012E15869|nr:putative cytokinetic ring protein SteA [Pseudactinotalea suaedae]
MRPLLNRRQRAREEEDSALGRVRVDPSTKTLTKRLHAGDIAVIDHLDIDRVSAEALVRVGPAAVLNAARSISGRYPNLGPDILVSAGIPLIDDLGPQVMELAEGTRVRIDEGTVYTAEGSVIAEGTRQTEDTIARDMAKAREGLSEQIEAFAANTMDYIRHERELLLDGVGVPDIRTEIAGRHVLIVVRGYSYKEDLAMLKPYIREYRPLLIGVDGGADAILDAGLRLDMIVGDMDSVSDKALTSGAEIVVHAYRDGRAPGHDRVEQLGVESVVFPATGTSEDVAMLLADDKGAELIVAVGTHETLVEFLDKGRSGMASTFLTRLRVGGKLIDAKGVSRLYEHRVSSVQVGLLVLAGAAAIMTALAVTPAGRALFAVVLARLDDLLSWFRSLVEAIF